MERLALFEVFSPLPVEQMECSIDVGKTGSRKHIQYVFIDGGWNTDGDSHNTDLIEAEASWVATAEAMSN